MSDIEQKARDMVLEVLRESELPREPTSITREYWKALCRAIEQHEAFRQEVSGVVTSLCNTVLVGRDHSQMRDMLSHRFIIPAPKPDPLMAMAEGMGYYGNDAEDLAEEIRAALDALGFEIREKG